MPLDAARILHVNVNCSQLDRSREFYEALGLTPGVRTAPATAQPGDAFGLTEAQWDAWILCGARGWDGALLDLLEWQRPAPTGTPPRHLYECGFQRLGLNVPDIDAAVAAVTRAGGAAWSAPFEHANPDGSAIRVVIVNDPDGTAIELFDAGTSTPAALAFVGVACRDLARSTRFYTDLGFVEVARFASKDDDARHLGIDGALEMEEVVFAAPGGGDMVLILVDFTTPQPVVAAKRPANALGMWRMALGVPDVDAAAAALTAAGATPLSPPVEMSMGDNLPMLRFMCAAGPDGEIVECIEQPSPASDVER